MRFEISEAWPMQALIQVDFSDNNRPPFFCVREGPSVMIPHGTEHPIARDVLIRAANEINMILTGTGGCEGGVTSPDGPCDDLRAAVAEFASHLGEESIIANHHAQLPEAGIKDGVVITGSD